MTAVAGIACTTTSPSRAAARFGTSSAAAEAFFEARADDVARACQAMARRFQSGGRLLVHEVGAARGDATHVVVEFMHPVVVGKRALPAIALSSAPSEKAGYHGGDALRTLARPHDILLVLSTRPTGATASSASLLRDASAGGLLTILLTASVDEPSPAAHVFAVSSLDPCIVQETHEMLYHVLWELVHVFLEHRAEVT